MALIIALGAYFEFFEVINLIRDGIDYITTLRSWINFFSPVINIYCIFYYGDERKSYYSILTAIAVLLMWY